MAWSRLEGVKWKGDLNPAHQQSKFGQTKSFYRLCFFLISQYQVTPRSSVLRSAQPPRIHLSPPAPSSPPPPPPRRRWNLPCDWMEARYRVASCATFPKSSFLKSTFRSLYFINTFPKSTFSKTTFPKSVFQFFFLLLFFKDFFDTFRKSTFTFRSLYYGC